MEDTLTLNPASAGGYDELRDARGEIRPHWKLVQDTIAAMGRAELERRHEEIQALLRSNGVTFHVYSAAEGANRLWPLDPVPLVVPSREWSSLERGLMQRAEVFNAVLEDLYGPQRLVATGVLPPELVFGHSGFLPGMYPMPQFPRPRSLLLYGVDLARGRDGSWRVLADRTQNPSGAGYALENRIVLSKALPSLFREANVHRLVGWFRTLRQSLRECAPQGAGNEPLIALLTPGPEHESYFEHAYLAQYLGLELVRGQDLAVREDKLWMKTVEGPRQIHVVLRRVNDGWCDPLYLRGDSMLGVPGLVRAVRAGNVAVVNPLGSGVLSNPALATFLPKAAKALLGEDLLLPSIDTFWCGDPAGLERLLRHPQGLVVKDIQPGMAKRRWFCSQLSPTDLAELRALVVRQPGRYVAQEEFPLSLAPTLSGEDVEGRRVVLRTFLAGHAGGYRVMPGGLSRVGHSADALVVSNQDGGIGKDTWILSSEPQDDRGMDRGTLLSVRARSNAISSSHAEDLFWIGRYSRRALHLVRLLREASGIHADASPYADTGTTAWVGAMLRTHVGPIFQEGTMPEPGVIFRLIQDSTLIGSLAWDLEAMQRCGRNVRALISEESWQGLNLLTNRVRDQRHVQMVALLSESSMWLQALGASLGNGSSAMEGHVFLEMGIHLETVSSAVNEWTELVEDGRLPQTTVQALLRLHDMYHLAGRRIPGAPGWPQLSDLLLFDEEVNGSLAASLKALVELSGRLPHRLPPRKGPEQRLLLNAQAAFAGLQEAPEEALRTGTFTEPLEVVGSAMRGLSDGLAKNFFFVGKNTRLGG